MAGLTPATLAVMHAMSAYYSSRAKVWRGGARSVEPRFVRMGRRRGPERTKEEIFFTLAEFFFFLRLFACVRVVVAHGRAVDLGATWANVRPADR